MNTLAYRYGTPARKFWCKKLGLPLNTAFVEVARCVIAAYPRFIWEGSLPMSKSVAAYFLDFAMGKAKTRPALYLDRTPLPKQLRRAA